MKKKLSPTSAEAKQRTTTRVEATMSRPRETLAPRQILDRSRFGSSHRRTIPLVTLAARIKRGLREHLHAVGFKKNKEGQLLPPDPSKASLRALHSAQREERLRKERDFIRTHWPSMRGYFANGTEVVPTAVAPHLEQVEADTWQSRLFRLAALTWSVPVSQGYGRRMRFLVWDGSNSKLMGLIALADPVFNLRVRDAFVGWSVDDRRERLANVMDACVLGSLPPYNLLLGGKLIACAIATKEIRDAFSRRYVGAQGIISGRVKKASLALVTTSSALGRSSVYNRLTLGDLRLFRSVGFTSGWGHFHIPDRLFRLIRKYLEGRDHTYANNYQYGDGPNWRLRAVREALSALGLRPDLLHHGIAREVFVCEIAANATAFLRGDVRVPRFDGLLQLADVARLAKDRWVLPRAVRRPQFAAWSRDDLVLLLSRQHRVVVNDEKSPSQGANSGIG